MLLCAGGAGDATNGSGLQNGLGEVQPDHCTEATVGRAADGSSCSAAADGLVHCLFIMTARQLASVVPGHPAGVVGAATTLHQD